MNCREIAELAPQFVSGEMEEGRRELFRQHLAQCRACAESLDEQTAMNHRLREAFRAELPDTTALERRVRVQIAGSRSRRWKIASVAAVVLLAAGLGYRMLRPDRIFLDAALDHRMEVMEHRPRHWRADPAEIGKLAARYQLADVAALAPAGYRLEHAKLCRLDGKPVLHLVYTNGAREFSVFVRDARGEAAAVRTIRVGSEHLVALRTARHEAVIATAGSGADCLDFARAAQNAL